MVIGRNWRDARGRDAWLVPQIVLALLLIGGMILLVLWAFQALTSSGRPAPEVEEAVKAAADEALR